MSVSVALKSMQKIEAVYSLAVYLLVSHHINLYHCYSGAFFRVIWTYFTVYSNEMLTQEDKIHYLCLLDMDCVYFSFHNFPIV